VWNTNKIKILNRDNLVLLLRKIFNFFEKAGHARAINRLTRQGLCEEAEVLVSDLKERELIKLEEMKRTKLYYNPLKHYIMLTFSPFMSINFEE
jgi:hypothetical protein